MTTEPEYLYGVDTHFGGAPTVERVRVIKRTKLAVWFADRPMVVGCRASWPHDYVAEHLADTPQGAVEKWRGKLREHIDQLDDELRAQRKLLDGPDPKNAWEAK